MSGHIVVVGSINMDLVVQAPHHPQPGETVLGRELKLFPGGKGANQAVAAARLGAEVKMIGLTGDDVFGRQLRESLAKDGVDLTHVGTAGGVTSGVALIVLDAKGQNTIVVAPGANGLVTSEYVSGCEAAFCGAKAVVIQLEIPLPAVQMAAELGRRHGAMVILNPAPAQELPPQLLAYVDELIPNQTELALITGTEDRKESADKLLKLGVKRLVVTLGGDGARLVSAGDSRNFPTFKVPVVDTTAAGDSFVGAYAVSLAESLTAEEACSRGVAAGALAVTKAGAQNSLPSRKELEEFLRNKEANS